MILGDGFAGNWWVLGNNHRKFSDSCSTILVLVFVNCLKGIIDMQNHGQKGREATVYVLSGYFLLCCQEPSKTGKQECRGVVKGKGLGI